MPAVQRLPTPEDEEQASLAEQSDSRDAEIVARLEQLLWGESVPSEQLRGVALDASPCGADPLAVLRFIDGIG